MSRMTHGGRGPLQQSGLTEVSHMLLVACQQHQEARNGFFTSALLDALKQDLSSLTYASIMLYMRGPDKL
jgi:hypothetical protein